MEDSLIGIVTTIGLGVIAWLCLNTIQNNRKIAVLSANSDEINIKINTVISSINNMNTKMDLFLKNELDTLKELSRASTDAISKIASR